MRAVVVHQFGDLNSARVEQRPDPTMAARSVMIRVKAAPVNYVDLVTFRGEYQFSPALPYVPGKGPAGEVCAIGPDVTEVAVGDRVLAMAEAGGYAELVAVDASQVHPLPDSLSYTAAAAMSLAFDTAHMALRDRGRLESGDTVLVLGASGSVGQAAVQLAKAMGAALVLAGVSRPDRPAGGADATIDLSRADLRNSVRAQVHDATGGHGADVVIDMLGGDVFDGAIRSVAWRGRYVIVGFATGRIPVLKMNYPMLKNIDISGLQISDYRKLLPGLVQRAYREVFAFYSHGELHAPANTPIPLNEWRTAFETLTSRGDNVRRVLVP